MDKCVNGHEWTEKNTYRPPRGGRVCRRCTYEASLRWKRRNKWPQNSGRIESPPTLRQLQAMDLVERAWFERRPLTIRELGFLLGIKSTNGVNDVLRSCERRGLLQRERQRSRSFRLTPEGHAELMGFRVRQLNAEVQR